jgi:hypothetical protein
MPKRSQREIAAGLQERFRELADKFAAWGRKAKSKGKRRRVDDVAYQAALEEAGRLIIEAVHAGFLADIPHLRELVDWAEGRSPHPLHAETAKPGKRPQSTLVPGPINVFLEVAGGMRVAVKNDGGRPTVTAPPEDGFLAARSPDCFTLDPFFVEAHKVNSPDAKDFARRSEAVKWERYVRACRGLARAIKYHQPDTAEVALDGLLHALQKHRLGFLYVAVPKRPGPNCKGLPERMYSDELPANQVRPVDGEDEDDDKFLFRHRAILERFADDAISQFGPGKGAKADVPGGQYPHWVLDEPVCQMLEQSSEELLEACKRLRTTDAAGVYHGLIQQVMSVAYDKGQSRWSSAIVVRWEYLDDLDKAIAALKKAMVTVPCPEPRTKPACKQATPTYFLTAQLPYMVLEAYGPGAVHDPDHALDPKATHEKKTCVFHRVDSRLVAEKLLELFRHGTPAPPADLAAPIGTLEALKDLLEWSIQPAFGILDTADLGFADRVLCQDAIGVLERIESLNDPDPGVWAGAGLPHDRRMVLVMRLRGQALQWEPLVRDELGGDEKSEKNGGQPAITAPTGQNGAPPTDEERETAIRALLNPLVLIDTGLSNLRVRMKQLREENPHGVFSDTPPTKMIFAQQQEFQNRILSWTNPIQDAIKEAKAKCAGIAMHVTGVVENPAMWETDLRTNLRLLGEQICSFHLCSNAATFARQEQLIHDLGCQIYIYGTRLDDAYQTIEQRLNRQRLMAAAREVRLAPEEEARSQKMPAGQAQPLPPPPETSLIRTIDELHQLFSDARPLAAGIRLGILVVNLDKPFSSWQEEESVAERAWAAIPKAAGSNNGNTGPPGPPAERTLYSVALDASIKPILPKWADCHWLGRIGVWGGEPDAQWQLRRKIFEEAANRLIPALKATPQSRNFFGKWNTLYTRLTAWPQSEVIHDRNGHPEGMVQLAWEALLATIGMMNGSPIRGSKFEVEALGQHAHCWYFDLQPCEASLLALRYVAYYCTAPLSASDVGLPTGAVTFADLARLIELVDDRRKREGWTKEIDDLVECIRASARALQPLGAQVVGRTVYEEFLDELQVGATFCEVSVADESGDISGVGWGADDNQMRALVQKLKEWDGQGKVASQTSERRITPCPLTVVGLAEFVGVSEGTIRNAYKEAGVPGPKAGSHGHSFTPSQVRQIAGKRAESKRCTAAEKAKWNNLLAQIDPPPIAG